MPRIIERPDAVGDWLTSYLTEESRRDAIRHEKELAARKKRQRTTAVVGTAAATVATAGLAAPALGLAGAAAIPATATAPAVAATTGLLGTGGAVGLTGYLAAAGLGAQLGGQFADEDYGGAIQTAAGAAQSIQQARENQKIYGFQPSKEGRASLAQLAQRAGTTIDALEQKARQGGGSVLSQLGLAQTAADDRAIENERYGAAAGVIGRAEGHDALDLLNNDIDTFGGDEYENVPDRVAFDQAQDARANIESDLASTAVTREDAANQAQSVRQMVGRAKLGRRRPRTPPISWVNPDGSTTEVPYGANYERGGKMFFANPDGKGGVKYSTADSNAPPPTPWGVPENREKWLADNTLPGGQVLVPEGFKLQAADPASERRDKVLADYAMKAYEANGVIPTSQEMATFAEGLAGVDQAIKDRQLFAEQLKGIADSQVLSIEDATALADASVEMFGENAPLAVRQSLDRITVTAAQAAVEAVAAQAAQAPTAQGAAPPAGSAAGAEAAGRSAARAIRGIPSAVAGIPSVPVKAGRAAVESVGKFITGLGEGLTGIERADTSPQARRAKMFAQVQAQNLSAGIDEPIGVIGPDGQIRQVIKGGLTPQKIAELKTAGFTIPGIE